MRPLRHVIADVPFVSWAEASEWDYKDKDILNASVPASEWMIRKYWGDEGGPASTPLGAPSAQDPQLLPIQGLDELKNTLAQNLPIMVITGLTPFGHPTATLWLQIAGDPIVDAARRAMGPHSGVLGTILPYETFAGVKSESAVTLKESAAMVARVVIGYDDQAMTVVLHDPSFGPAWEIRQDDFERMWAPFDRHAFAMTPPDDSERLGVRQPAGTYPPRTIEQQAAQYFAYAYALACVGRIVEARHHYRQGLDLPDLTPEWEHLFLIELSLLTRDRAEAIRLLRRATDVVPENAEAWRMLAHVYWVAAPNAPLIHTLLDHQARAIWTMRHAVSLSGALAGRVVPREMLFLNRAPVAYGWPNYLDGFKPRPIAVLIVILGLLSSRPVQFVVGIAATIVMYFWLWAISRR